MLVEFTKSQNSTVRWRRSPVKRWSLGSAFAWTAAASSGAPHLPQKFEVGELSAPHFMQILTRAFPHCSQKLLLGGLLVPHFEQRISSPGRRDSHLIYHPARLATTA